MKLRLVGLFCVVSLLVGSSSYVCCADISDDDFESVIQDDQESTGSVETGGYGYSDDDQQFDIADFLNQQENLLALKYQISREAEEVSYKFWSICDRMFVRTLLAGAFGLLSIKAVRDAWVNRDIWHLAKVAAFAGLTLREVFAMIGRAREISSLAQANTEIDNKLRSFERAQQLIEEASASLYSA